MDAVHELPPESGLQKIHNFFNQFDRFTKIAIFTMVLILMTVPAIIIQQTNLSSKASGTGLLQNGSFEIYKSGQFSSWNFYRQIKSYGTLTQDQTGKIDGNASAKIVSLISKPDSPNLVQLQQAGLDLKPATYVLNFWVKADSIRNIQVVLQQSTSPYLYFMSQIVPTSTTWKQQSITFTLSKSDNNAAIRFYTAQTKGTIWLDNVTLTKIFSTTKVTSAPTKALSAPTPTTTVAPTIKTGLPTPTLVPVRASTPSSAPTPKAVTGTTRPISLVMYGSNSTAVDKRIIAAKPEYLICNTAHNPWEGNCTASKFNSAGIKVFSYITAGYENGYSESIPNDLASNLGYIDSIALSDRDTYGIFLDEVDNYPDVSAYPVKGSAFKLDYLNQISQKVHNKGMKLMCNTGSDNWDDRLMSYCDFLMSTEDYKGAALTASQKKWADRVVILSQNVTDAETAIQYTNKALSLGLHAVYTGPYIGLPVWFETYVAGIPLR
jgi:hypothetical protein